MDESKVKDMTMQFKNELLTNGVSPTTLEAYVQTRIFIALKTGDCSEIK